MAFSPKVTLLELHLDWKPQNPTYSAQIREKFSVPVDEAMLSSSLRIISASGSLTSLPGSNFVESVAGLTPG